jgi:hypothetical protein
VKIALLVLGILLSIATGLMGLLFVLWGVTVGLLGMGPLGPIRDPGTRILVGDLPLVLGLIYLVPVIALRRLSWVAVYAVVTLVAAFVMLIVASNIALESTPRWPMVFLFLAPAAAWVAYARLRYSQPES